MSNVDNEARIRSWAALRRLPEAHLDRWLAMEAADRDRILNIAEDLRLRTGQFIAAFDMIDEIQVRENKSAAEVLAAREIKQILEGGGSTPGRARALLDTLRLLRFPRLRETANRISAKVINLGLPPGLRVVLPSNLSSDELRVELTAHGGAELRRLIEVLAGSSADLCRIADALDGADEL
jgi:hypothetical protein